MMTPRGRSFVALVLAMLLVAACGVSFAHAADIGTDVCSATKAWGSARTDVGSSASQLFDLAAAPLGFVGSNAPVPTWVTTFPEPLDRVTSDVFAEPNAPRAPPIA